MKISNETGVQFETREETKTDFQTEAFRLKIIEGKGHFTTQYVFKPVCETKRLGSIYTGHYWSEFSEAIREGLEMLPECQRKHDEEMEELKKKYKVE